ncbi:MAG: ABC transporter permease [Fusobacteriaceae bacterium]
MQKRKTSLFIFIGIMIFFYLPLVFLVIYSFNDNKSMIWTGFTLKWYKKLFLESADIWSSVEYSIIIAVISGFIATTIGTLAAIGIRWYEFKTKNFLQILNYLPLVTPEIITGVSLLILFSAIKFPLGIMTVFIAHTTFSVPFVFFVVMSRLQEFDYSVVEVAYDLGATEFQTLSKVVLPMLMPAIISGFLISVTLSFDDFVTTFFVAGPGSTTLPLRIYSMVRVGVSPVINAISALLIGIAMILTFSTSKIQKYVIK